MKPLNCSYCFLIITFLFPLKLWSAVDVPHFSVYELAFKGISYKVLDNPVRDVALVTIWQNEQSRQSIIVHGFFDGDGTGGKEGNVFKVRFCPVEKGIWTLTGVQSNDPKLNGQHLGFQVNALSSDLHGFWIVDRKSPGSRWYCRSDGSHQYITGNTMYSFLSEHFNGKPTGGGIRADIINNSKYFRKVRMGITGDRYPHPDSKPFLDHEGKPTDDGNFSHRPNPEWFFNRVDLAVKTGFEKDLIIDLILCGPDTKESRSILKASENKGIAEPFLKYMAARYGSYPNVWMCLANEFDIKEPFYKCDEIIRFGKQLQSLLPCETPVSVHSVRHWTENLNSPVPWFDHVILQTKLKKMDESADNIQVNYLLGGADQPVIDDELAYEGAGDGWNEQDVIEAFLGVFSGGGYGSSGHKSANKEGHYFYGNFKAEEHSAADNLAWFRKIIDDKIAFWKMSPVSCTHPVDLRKNIFRENSNTKWRVMADENREYLIAGNSSGKAVALLPAGKWRIVLYNLITMNEEILSESASGRFEFSFPDSRAALVHFLLLQ